VVERSQVEALAARVAAVESSEKTAARGDRAVRLVLVAHRAQGRGRARRAVRRRARAAKALGADPTLTAALEPFAASGVPTSPRSRASSPRSRRRCVRPRRAPARESFLERLQVNAEKLVRVRPTE
jgi:hypothetical protein